MSISPTHRVLPPTPTKSILRRPLSLPNSQQRNSFREDEEDHGLSIGNRVITHGKSGTIAFTGTTQFAEGIWIGIILDELEGKNDGSHGGVRYFTTDPNRGLFCRPDKVELIPVKDTAQRNSLYAQSMCPVTEETRSPSVVTFRQPRTPSFTKDLQIGDRVAIRGTKFGTLYYIGKFHVDNGIWCGIKLDSPCGKHDGKVEGIRYFKCQHRYGIFAPLHSVEKIANDTKDLRELNRQSINSMDYNDQCTDSNSEDLNVSELSTLTNSARYSSARSSPHISQPNFSRDINSTVASSSTTSEISNLIEKLKEKDIIIEQLKHELEKDRSEVNSSIENIQRMKKQMITLQQQHTTKENQNSHLIQEQVQLKQNSEDLQFQLEERQNSESFIKPTKILYNKKQSLFNNNLENSAEIKEKLTQLESINQNLIHEKENLQKEIKQLYHTTESEQQAKKHIAELEKQIETLKSNITDLQNKEQMKTNQWNEHDTFYKNQIRDYQSKLDQIKAQDNNNRLQLTKFEQDKIISDKQIKDLLNEIKQLKENIIPDLEEECEILKSELQNRDSTTHLTLQEREVYFQQQIKQYENNLDQAMRETQTIQTELTKLEAEKARHDHISNNAINTLKQDYEKQYELLKEQFTQLQNKDQTHNIILNERKGYYEIQLKEHQMKINQHMREIELLQTEITNLQQENLSNQKQWEELANKYTKEYQILENELDERNRVHNLALNECETHYQAKLKDLQMKQDQLLIEMEELHSDTNKLNEEKINIETRCNETIKSLKEEHKKKCNEFQNEIDELNEREHNAHRIVHQHEIEFEQHIQQWEKKVEHANYETRQIQNQLGKIQEEKIQLNDMIDTLKQEIEKLKTQLLDRDRRQNAALEERNAYYELRMKEYEIKREHDLHEIQVLRTELTNSQEDKLILEKQSNDMKTRLEHDYDKLKNQLYEQDQIQTMTLNEREILYQSQIKELQTKRDQSLTEIQNLLSQLGEIREEKTISEYHLNQTITNLKQDYERQTKEFQIEINALNERERTAHKSVKQRETEFEQQIVDYEDQLEHANLEIERIQFDLAKFQEEKIKLDSIINSLKQEIERLRMELEERDRRQDLTLNKHEANFQSQLNHLREEKFTIENQLNIQNQEYENKLKEYSNKIEELHEQERTTKLVLQQQITTLETQLEQVNREIQNIQTELLTSQEEKVKLNDMNNSLKQTIERLQRELQEQNQTENMTFNEREIHYQNQIEELQTSKHQSNTELQNLQLKIKDLDETINSLKQDHIRKQQDLQTEIDELNERERGINTALQQREIEIEQEIKHYKDQLKQTVDEIQEMQNQVSMLEEEKVKLNETNNTLKQNLQKIETESHDREQIQNMVVNEHEIHYQTQIKDLQMKLDQSLTEIQNLQSQFAEVRQEKTTNEHQLTEALKSLHENNEKLQNELKEKENEQKQILEEYELKNKQQITHYEKKLEISARELANLQEEKQMNESIQRDLMMSIQEEVEKTSQTYKTQIMKLEKNLEIKTNELNEKEQQIEEYQSKTVEFDKEFQKQNDLNQHIENLTKINEKLKEELNDLKTRTHQTITSDSNQPIDDKQLVKQLNDLQQVYNALLENQAKMEQTYAEEKRAQEKILKDKCMEYETKLVLSRNEFMVEMENANLDHAQEILVLKNKLQEAQSTKKRK